MYRGGCGQDGDNLSGILDAIREGAVLRIRPKAMTVAVIQIMWRSGTGPEAIRRIAAPMVGGMIKAPLLSMYVFPVAYLLLRLRRINKAGGRPQPIFSTQL